MTDEILVRVLRAASATPGSAEHPLKTKECPPLPRFAVARAADWTAKERGHLAIGCPYCARMLAIQERVAGADAAPRSWLELLLAPLYEAASGVQLAARLAEDLLRPSALTTAVPPGVSAPLLRLVMQGGGRGSAAASGGDLRSWLDRGELLEFEGDGGWIGVRVDGEAIEMQAGTSALEPFQRFRVEFRRGEEPLWGIDARDDSGGAGTLRLTPSDFQEAGQRGADRLVLLPPGRF